MQCVCVCLHPPPPTNTTTTTSHHTSPPPEALPLFLSMEGRYCLTHTRYSLTISQPVLWRQIRAIAGGEKPLQKERGDTQREGGLTSANYLSYTILLQIPLSPA